VRRRHDDAGVGVVSVDGPCDRWGRSDTESDDVASRLLEAGGHRACERVAALSLVPADDDAVAHRADRAPDLEREHPRHRLSDRPSDSARPEHTRLSGRVTVECSSLTATHERFAAASGRVAVTGDYL
jgi:hypothetical protein